MPRSTRRARALCLLPVIALLLGSPGCYGPFKAVHAIHELNDEPHNKWLKELVFLAFVIFPVYEIGILIDVLILNPIDFFDE